MNLQLVAVVKAHQYVNDRRETRNYSQKRQTTKNTGHHQTHLWLSIANFFLILSILMRSQRNGVTRHVAVKVEATEFALWHLAQLAGKGAQCQYVFLFYF